MKRSGLALSHIVSPGSPATLLRENAKILEQPFHIHISPLAGRPVYRQDIPLKAILIARLLKRNGELI